MAEADVFRGPSYILGYSSSSAKQTQNSAQKSQKVFQQRTIEVAGIH
jgi:hypothetical protein